MSEVVYRDIQRGSGVASEVPTVGVLGVVEVQSRFRSSTPPQPSDQVPVPTSLFPRPGDVGVGSGSASCPLPTGVNTRTSRVHPGLDSTCVPTDTTVPGWGSPTGRDREW